MTPQKFFFFCEAIFLFKWAIFLCKDNCPLSEGCFDCHPYRDSRTTVRVRVCAKKVLSHTQTNDGETLAVQILANKCGTTSSSSRSWKVGNQVGLLSPCPNQVFNTSSILKDSMLSSPRFLLSIVSSLSLKFSTLMTLLVLGWWGHSLFPRFEILREHEPRLFTLIHLYLELNCWTHSAKTCNLKSRPQPTSGYLRSGQIIEWVDFCLPGRKLELLKILSKPHRQKRSPTCNQLTVHHWYNDTILTPAANLC